MAPAHRLLGLIAREERRWKAAEAEFQALVRLQPWSADGYRLLAEAQEHLGNVSGARATLAAASRSSLPGALPRP